ncbi:Cytochrome P450, partial [Dillenia turbinata]
MQSQTTKRSKEISSLTNGIISRAAFGEKCKDVKAFISLINELMEVTSGFTVCDVFPSLTWLQVLSGMRPKIERMHHKVDKMFESIIDVHKVSAERAKKTEDEAEEEDLVDVLLKLQQREDLEFLVTDENVKAVIL